MKGLPKSLIKKYGISKKAWRIHKAGKKRPKRARARTSRVSNPKTKRRKTRRMARRKKKRGKRGFTVPLSIVAPIVAIPFVPSKEGWASPLEDAQKKNWKAVGAHLVNGFQPFFEVQDPNTFKGNFGFHIPRYIAMLTGGVLTHMVASKLGINRAIGRAGVPVIRV